MIYPGTPSLALDVQERISNTFQQTLNLVTESRDQEALVGCEFILRMDPEFQPAKTLVARLKSGQRPVVIEDLKELPDGGDDLSSLDDLSDLEGLDELSFDEEPASESPPAISKGPPPVEPAAASGLAAVVQDLLARRNFEQILQIAETQKRAVAGDPGVQRLVAEARTLLESDAFVRSFLQSAAEARASDRLEEMENHLDKARALDPGHPHILAFTAAGPAPEEPEDGLTFDADEDFPEVLGPYEVPRAAADDDLLLLQQQSLSLDSAEAQDELANELARDPRQTKPMDSVAGADDEPPQASSAAGALDDLGADLFDEQDLAPDAAEGLGAETELDSGALDNGAEGDGAFDAAGDVPAAEESSGGADRVAQLLGEGQEAFDRGEYQSAIDVWSRIFLIDIDNQDASSKIDEARSKKAEIERHAEELFHEALGHVESQSVEEAKRLLGVVLELLPSHSLAREYLEQLEAGKMPQVSPVGDLEMVPPVESAGEREPSAATSAAGGASLAAAVERDRVVVVKKTDMRVVALGAVVLLAVLGAGGFLLLKWDDLFPNQEPPPQMAQQPRKVDPIERATKMHESDQTENAILLLERIQPQDPVYEDAQALIAQWKALVETPPEPADTGPSEEQRQRYELLLSAAREAHGQNRFLRARRYFELAGKVLPLGDDERLLARDCDDRLQPLADQIALFAEGQYTALIPQLWRKRDSEPGNLDVERLLVDSYYNLALTDLQRGNAGDAAKKMTEALEIQPDNLELKRLQLFAQTYAQRQQDLLYRIFVKYLPSR